MVSQVYLVSFPGTRNEEGVPGIQYSCMHDPPGFSGELGNYYYSY